MAKLMKIKVTFDDGTSEMQYVNLDHVTKICRIPSSKETEHKEITRLILHSNNSIYVDENMTEFITRAMDYQ